MGFQRFVEDFRCDVCDAQVEGDGYTNHCPTCLWSKHVDRLPGDRAHPCRGLMEPVELRTSRHGFDVVHRCTTCHEVRTCRTVANDNLDALL